jgi:hypothetical protein
MVVAPAVLLIAQIAKMEYATVAKVVFTWIQVSALIAQFNVWHVLTEILVIYVIKVLWNKYYQWIHLVYLMQFLEINVYLAAQIVKLVK